MWEKTQMSINSWTDKQQVVYLHNGVLFSHTKEWGIDTYRNMDEPWKHYAKWKKPDPKKVTYYTTPFV